MHVHPQDPRLIALEVGHKGTRYTVLSRSSSSASRPDQCGAHTSCGQQIDHMDNQVHLYDTREGGFGRKPWLEFGYRSVPPKPRSTSSRSAGYAFVPKQGSRYIRGSTVNSLFARGYNDGVVLVWDYRNGAQKVRADMATRLPLLSLTFPSHWRLPTVQRVLERFQFQRPGGVVHTVLAGSDVIAYGGYSVTFWSMLSG
ncbi:hypothetical protein BD414DRAFT_473889 [Trametes punicea]|nr:hypothetical protein BD414DRAFT_473889 [Trametes punicea]